MASSSSSFYSPPTPSCSWRYDVFLSFRGEDTRKNFVDHLYSALIQRVLNTYKDDETLPRGESIGPSLLKAIEESHIALIIFSKNYADSSWCLDELACIMKCRDDRGQIVMPIFYDVEPSEVRKQRGEFGKGFAKHESENYDKIESWRNVLVAASNLSGWELKHTANGHESKCIKEIADTISSRLHPVISGSSKNLIGIEARAQDLKLKLQLGSGGVLMIGIWGVGGGGKTTLASSIFDEISGNFVGCCFIENIREETSKYGLKILQEKILSSVSKQNQMEVGRVEEGRRMIKSRLCHKKVLIVLDDVEDLEQLQALAGSHDWFGEGSRIIITTRDNHILNTHKINVMHNISLLNTDEAIKLFSKHAPQGNRALTDYEHFLKEVVSYACGLPLALEVLGCFLCDKDINEWASALARLKEIPETDIVEKLKISFDGLKPVEKALFLDIACFYRGLYKNYAMDMLDACGFHPVIGVKVLIQKALITINWFGEFDMHDLVQEMGHYIVRGEHPNNPEKHSRVWKNRDILQICSLDATMDLDKIEAIRYSPECHAVFDWDALLPCHLEAVANMKKLRLIDWEGLCGSSLPTKFLTGELCCLRLGQSRQRQLWEGFKYLPNLRFIHLSSMTDLIMTPDFNGLPNLERFMLYDCGRLEDIHPSIGHLERLVLLNIGSCGNLKIFPPITRSKKLKTLIISSCPKLSQDSEIQQIHPDKITRQVASYKQNSTNLRKWFRRRICFCNNPCGDTELEKQPDKIATDVKCGFEKPSLPHNSINSIGLHLIHKGLRKLYINDCELGDDDIGSIDGELSILQELDVSGNKFSRINFTFLQLPRLKWLNVSRCKNLVELFELPSSIAVLTANDCPSLQRIVDFSNCKWLWKVSLIRYHASPMVDEILNSVCQGNAIEDHFISLAFPAYEMEFVDRLIRGKRFTLQLLHEHWHDDFCGFLICIVTSLPFPLFTLILKPEIGKDFQSEVWQESNEGLKPPQLSKTYVGYVSFNLLKRHAPWWNSEYNMISISVTGKSRFKDEIWFGGELVCRKSTVDAVKPTRSATVCSDFWDEEFEDEKTFSIQHDLNSIEIVWRPCRKFPF